MSRKTIDENNELMTTQPFNVAFGKHEVSSIEDNILTTIGGTLQNQTTNKASISHDLLNVAYIKVTCNEIEKKNDKRRVLNKI